MDKKKNKNVAENVKDVAGAAFHNAHDALESTENAAMNTVDATADAFGKVNSKNKKNQ